MQTGDIGEMMHQFKANGESIKDANTLASEAQETLEKASQTNVQLASDIKIKEPEDTSLETQKLLDEANAVLGDKDTPSLIVEKSSNSTDRLKQDKIL